MPGERAALLSHDTDSGAFTTAVWLPPDFRTPAPEVHSIDQEEIVLWGDFWLDGIENRAPYYHFFPAGTEHGPVHTNNGCVLVFVHGSPIDVSYRPDDAWSGS